jgi:hypothetical protein
VCTSRIAYGEHVHTPTAAYSAASILFRSTHREAPCCLRVPQFPFHFFAACRMFGGGRKLNTVAHLVDEAGTIQSTLHLYLIFQQSCCEINFVMCFTVIMCGIYDLFVNSAVKYL